MSPFPPFSAPLLDGKSLEAALPHMPAAVVMTMVSPHVRGEQPLHPAAQIAVAARPEDEMKVVVHKNIA
jgi:uncharacterized membrane protein